MPEELTLDQLNDLLRACGCCEHPVCCPPLIECQSGFGRASSVGFIDTGTSDDRSESGFFGQDWKQTRYLKRLYPTTWTPDDDGTTTIYGRQNGTTTEGPSYVEVSSEGEITRDDVSEFSQSFNGSTGGAYFTGDCETSEAVYSTRCEVGGTMTTSRFVGLKSPAGIYSVHKTSEVVCTPVDIAGTETAAHMDWETESAEWDAANPGGMTAWQAAADLLQEWWDTPPGERGDMPPDPGDPRPDEPAELYPPCTIRTDVTTTNWDIVWESGVPHTELTPATEESPNPYTYRTTGIYTQHSVETTHDVEFATAVTFEQWQAAVREWIDSVNNFDHVEQSDSRLCVPGTGCVASQNYYPLVADGNQSWMTADWFRYRIKLDKCCAWELIQSKWLEVKYPRVWLEWKALMDAAVGSDSLPAEPAQKPEPTVKAWSWEGTPPRCEDSTSDSAVTNHYDHEPMWSPWSLVIMMPAGEEGEIRNRYYHQKCYEAPWQYMPQIFGEYDTSDSTLI